MKVDKPRVVVITGPTATGKSLLAVELAELFGCEIVSADSMQVYRYMDIGTAKPPEELRRRVAHHLIDIVNPDEDYNAARYSRDAMEAVLDIKSRGRGVIVAGGTGLYIRALIYGLFEGVGACPEVRKRLLEEAQKLGRAHLYQKLSTVDPEAARTIHPHNINRIVRALEVFYTTGKPISFFQKEHGFKEERLVALKIALTKPRKILYKDIEARVDRMLEEGLTEEVKRLLSMGYTKELKPLQAIGYREIIDYLEGRTTLDEAVRRLKKNTKDYAKRQITWLKKEKGIIWFNPEQKEDIINRVKAFLKED